MVARADIFPGFFRIFPYSLRLQAAARLCKALGSRQGGSMRKWYVPLAVLGIAGLGALLLTDRGRQTLRWLSENLQRAVEWNEAAQRELDRIQIALNRVAESLEAVQ